MSSTDGGVKLVQYWLKSLGTAEENLDQLWVGPHDDVLEAFACPKDRRPGFAKGDRVVYYAAGWQKIFAIVEVIKEEGVARGSLAIRRRGPAPARCARP
jgi:hypothetical protein